MYQPIMLSKTTSFRTTSQVTRRKKLHSLIAGVQPVAPIMFAFAKCETAEQKARLIRSVDNCCV